MELDELKSKLTEFTWELGYTLSEFSYKKRNGEMILSLVVDRVEPIDLDAITELSEKISLYLDELDPISEGYTLDVSSLGAEKPLKKEELSLYTDRYVNVHLTNPVNGENIYEGTLKSVTETDIILTIKIKSKDKDLSLALDNISKIRLAVN
ncbi:MAG: ribosome maturation factor RimP [Coprobacillus sp.]|nr:ribosome maturation factor RimP [Coprobacillus sp.]